MEEIKMEIFMADMVGFAILFSIIAIIIYLVRVITRAIKWRYHIKHNKLSDFDIYMWNKMLK